MSVSRRAILKFMGWVSVLIPFMRKSSRAQYNTGAFWKQPGNGAGELWIMGDTSFGEVGLGLDTTTKPKKYLSGSWTQVSANENGYHTLGIRTDGTLWAWGYNYYGAIQPGAGTVISSPIQIAGSWSQVVAGQSFSLAIKTDATLWAWGYNYDGLLGNGTAGTVSTPTQIAGSWKMVTAGGVGLTNYPTNAILGIKLDGTLWAWGNNYNCQLGDGGTTSSTTAKQIAGSWTMISCGGYDIDTSNCAGGGNGSATLGVKTDGTVWGWGINNKGQLGTNNTTAYSNPVQINGGYTSVAISECAGGFIKSNGTLWISGTGLYGQLGNSSTSTYSSPVQVSGTWKNIFLGSRQSFGLKSDGQLFGWGSNFDGNLGIDTEAVKTYTPVQISGSWSQVAVGKMHTLAINSAAELYAWGCSSTSSTARSAAANQLGTWPAVNTFTKLSTLSWAQIASGPMALHCIATAGDGTLWGWGRNAYGQLGNLSKYVKTPTALGISNVSQISLGADHTLFVKPDGTLWGMGSNSNGEIDPTTSGISSYTSPLQIHAGKTWVQVAAGKNYSLGLAVSVSGGVSSYSIYGWGNNTSYQCAPSPAPNSPVTQLTDISAGATNWAQVWASSSWSFMRKADGSLYTTGSPNGVVYGSAVAQISGVWNKFTLGASLAYGFKSDGILYELDPGITTSVSGQSFTQMVAGAEHFLGLKANGTLWVWGAGPFGQTPVAGTIGLSYMNQVSGSWSQIAAGAGYTLAIRC